MRALMAGEQNTLRNAANSAGSSTMGMFSAFV